MSVATVKLWGTAIGYVSMDADERFARFEYDPAFAHMNVQPAPLMMPVTAGLIHQFPDLNRRSFHGLPGLLADSLPDKYGNRLINIWLARSGRTAEQFNAVDRLCYIGRRGMGALEFEPGIGDETAKDRLIEMDELVALASMAFAEKEQLHSRLTTGHEQEALLDILSVGASAGGARAKAVIAFNPDTRQVRTGQLQLPAGFEHWLIKFDGVVFNGDWGIADPAGYGLLEYSYYRTARACGIDMMESRVFQENGRSHFMTRRFDRDEQGGKYFVQSFAALNHFDYYDSGHYSYEQLFMTMRQLGLSKESMEEQFRRVVFNIVGCNQDDHVKNFAFMMDRQGRWQLAPAYDLCHAEGSDFTRFHQLSINGKVSGFTLADLKHLAEYAGLPRNREKRVLENTIEAFKSWEDMAKDLGIPGNLRAHVRRTLRLSW